MEYPPSGRDAPASAAISFSSYKEIDYMSKEKAMPAEQFFNLINDPRRGNRVTRACISIADPERMKARAHGLNESSPVPVLVKDNIDTMELGNSGGSLALRDVPVQEDAFIVGKLLQAGGLVVGKTNLSEWANFRSTRSVSGWSSAGGLTRNPHVLNRTACGSSSGSAAGVAAGYTEMAIGTETDGSIICPSAMNGVVGLKPGVGRVSRSGIIPISASQDTAGPIARTVAGAAWLLAAIEGEDPEDPATVMKERWTADAPGAFLGMKNFRGRRVGVLKKPEGFDPGVLDLYFKRVSRIMELGAELIELDELPGGNALNDAEFTVLLCEFKDDIRSYLSKKRSGSGFTDLGDLIAYNSKHAKNVMPFFGQELFEMSWRTSGRSDGAYGAAKETCTRLAVDEGLRALFNTHKLDTLAMPSNNPAWLIDPVLGDCVRGSTSSPAAVSGWPSLTLPMGELYGLPLGLSLLGKPWSEARLLGMGHCLERDFRIDTRAGFRPSVFTQDEPGLHPASQAQ